MAMFGKSGKDTGARYSTPDRWEGSRAYYESIANTPVAAGGEGGGPSYGEVAQARSMLEILKQYPDAVHISQVPGYERIGHEQSNSLGQQFLDFVTHPAFLTAAGGVAGVAAGGGAAAAGAGSGGGAAGGVAASDAALAAGAAGGAAGTAGGGLTAAQAAGVTSAAGGAAAGGAATGGASTGATTAAQQTSLSKILAGTGSSADYLTVFGQVAPSLLGMYASDKQADKLGAQAARYEAMGAPYRDRLGALYSDPTAFLNSPEVKIPVQQGTDALARSLSTQGNPMGSGHALQELQNYSANQLFSRLGQEKDRLGGFGGLTQYQAQAPQIGMAAINAEGNVYNALGHGIGAVTQPPRSLAEILKQYNLSQGLA